MAVGALAPAAFVGRALCFFTNRKGAAGVGADRRKGSAPNPRADF